MSEGQAGRPIGRHAAKETHPRRPLSPGDL